MNLYVNQLNVECQMVYERQLKEYKERLHSSEPVGAVPANEPGETNVPEGIDNIPERLLPQPLEQILSQPLEQILPQSMEQSSPNPQSISLPEQPYSSATFGFITTGCTSCTSDPVV